MPPVVAPAAPQDAASTLADLEQNIAQVIRGKTEAIRLSLTTLLAGGHLLIEDVPGVGKTTLARALARSVGGTFRRIQFTSDLLPSDIIGVSIFNREQTGFEFRPGPVFANVVLADEINRTTPRTQSSLLEAMAEGSVSVDNETHSLPVPFMVIATQNPQEHFGTYPLPESQMDRFLLRVQLGYPEYDSERQVLTERGAEDPVQALGPVVSPALVRELKARTEKVRMADELVDYIMEITKLTRQSSRLALGVSTRGAIAWHRAAQAYALVNGRDYCVPDDLKRLALPALAHRVVPSAHQESLGRTREATERAIEEILARVPVPG